MGRYSFSPAERYGVFTAHLERCWLCDEPLSLSEMEIDHIIPEFLDGKAELKRILSDFGLGSDFKINSFINWMPAHRKCNRVKGSSIFRPSPMIQRRLQLAEQRAPKAEKLCIRYASDRRINSALEELIAASSSSALSSNHKDRLKSLVCDFHEENRAEEQRGKIFMLTPWLEVIGHNGGMLMMRGPGQLIGMRPPGQSIDPSWDCPRCGITGWNGTRCIICGMMDDGQ